MTRRFDAWMVGAVLFTLVNIGGGIYAAMLDEPMHAAVHAGLTLVGVYLMLRLARRGERQAPASVPLAEDRIEYLQQSVDAVALEVERIGEVQRFDAKRQAERTEPGR